MSKETKDRKQVYAWLAEGRDVQVNIHGWTTCSEQGLLRHLLSGSDHTYRVEESIYFGSYKAPKPTVINIDSWGHRTEHSYYAVGDLTISVHAENIQTVEGVQRALISYIEDLGLTP